MAGTAPGRGADPRRRGVARSAGGDDLGSVVLLGGGLAVAVALRSPVRRLVGMLRTFARRTRRFGREEHLERCAAAFAFLHPRAAAVELRELRNESEPDADARTRSLRTATERLEDACALLLRNARAVVLHGDQHAAVRGVDGDPHGGVRRRVPDG